MIPLTTHNLPHLPILPAHKSSRVVTKHYTILPLHMEHKYFALLTWLIYQSGVDNRVLFSYTLLRRYAATVNEANEHYNPGAEGRISNGLYIGMHVIRANIDYLVKNGYLIAYNKRCLLINPLLTHTDHLTGRKWAEVCERYQQFLPFPSPEELKLFCEDYILLIRKILHLL